jgi:glycosyltransferase involved in cell wall biosynthesis
LVVTLHGVNVHPRYLHGRYQQRRLRPALGASDRVILVGEPLHKFFRRYIGSDRNFQVVPNGIDLPPQGLDRPTLENGPRRMVSVANLHEGKGIDLTLRALARLDSEGVSNWTYRIIGKGQERAALLKLTTDLGLANKVTFSGLVRHAEIFDHLAGDEIFVLPSYREAFGIAYLEAMAAGLLTIGVMEQGPSQFIRNGENGILVPPCDLEALVAALRDILTGDPHRWREIAHEGQRTVQNAYTWDNHARQLTDVYEHVIEKKKRSFAE